MILRARASSTKDITMFYRSSFLFIVRISASQICGHACRILRINLPAGAHPTGVAFSEGSSSVVVAAQALLGSSLYMYADVSAPPAAQNKQQGSKLSPPEIKWSHQKIHGKESVLNLAAARATHGSGDGSTIIISCSEGVPPSFCCSLGCLVV
jgi:hypothetical protein